MKYIYIVVKQYPWLVGNETASDIAPPMALTLTIQYHSITFISETYITMKPKFWFYIDNYIKLDNFIKQFYQISAENATILCVGKH